MSPQLASHKPVNIYNPILVVGYKPVDHQNNFPTLNY